MLDDIVSLIIETVNELSEDRQLQIVDPIRPDTALYGQEGILDSMALVSLVVAVEQAINDGYDVNISLADEKALSQKSSPFRTVLTLAQYASRLIQEARADG